MPESCSDWMIGRTDLANRSVSLMEMVLPIVAASAALGGVSLVRMSSGSRQGVKRERNSICAKLLSLRTIQAVGWRRLLT